MTLVGNLGIGEAGRQHRVVGADVFRPYPALQLNELGFLVELDELLPREYLTLPTEKGLSS